MLKNNKLSRLVSRAGLLALACAAVCGAARAAPALKLHVPSPDWRDQIIYFALTDRFADGDAGNNDFGAGEFKAGDNSRYNGGDLAGLRQRLPYIRGLGATALWITPPVANQWLEPSGSHAGYHGYWAEHFKKLDRHVGSLADYQRLSSALHESGMYLVQDIVVNHTGNFFTYRDRWNRADPAQGYEPHDASPPVPRPSQPPFDRNDPRDPAQRAAAIYHWTPDVSDYNDVEQERNFQMAGLDDLNTENPVVRRALRDSYGYWIRTVGVDAFRVDTAFYVPPDYFADFLHARDPHAPGIAEVARRSGRRGFLSFGEGFAFDPPGQDTAMRKIEGYMHDSGGRELLPGMLNFPLYGALGDTFARGRPPAELGARITAMVKLHSNLHLMPSFVDNHDVDRFLAGGSAAALQQALLALMTLPGIPVIYYGTEQGFTEQRAAMFAAGYGSGGRDRYDTAAPLYRAIAQMTALRRGHQVFSRGLPTVLAGNAAQPGALAWRMDAPAGVATAGRTGVRTGVLTGRRTPAAALPTALVVFNTADSPSLLADVDTGLPAGTRLVPLHGLHGLPQPLVVGVGGRITLPLAARAGMVWQVAGQSPARQAAASALAGHADPAPVVDALASNRVSGDFAVSGFAGAAGELQLVVDGDLARAQRVAVAGDGRWRASVDTSRMVDPEVTHRLTAWVAGRPAAAGRDFQVVRDWQLRADVEDPAGDDHGLRGDLQYPTDPGWAGKQLADIRRVRVFESGGALRLEVTMPALSTAWNPPNGFDHVAFTVYIELPGVPGGERVMPLQNATLPEGMRWHLRLRAGGWTGALFTAAGASAGNEGTPVSPGAALKVDRAGRTVSFTLPASAIVSAVASARGGQGGLDERLPSLSGAKVYVTTWDYDGGYRPLAPQAAPYAFGGAPADAPRVMDASAVIVLP